MTRMRSVIMLLGVLVTSSCPWATPDVSIDQARCGQDLYGGLEIKGKATAGVDQSLGINVGGPNFPTIQCGLWQQVVRTGSASCTRRVFMPDTIDWVVLIYDTTGTGATLQGRFDVTAGIYGSSPESGALVSRTAVVDRCLLQ